MLLVGVNYVLHIFHVSKVHNTGVCVYMHIYAGG